MELKIPRCQVTMVTSYALSLVTNYLCKSPTCKRHLDLSSLSEMTSLLRCLLCSKSAVCQLRNVELDHLASLLLQVCIYTPAILTGYTIGGCNSTCQIVDVSSYIEGMRCVDLA